MANGIKLETIAPALFVLIWSTGWIVAKYVSLNTDPLTFLVYRFFIATLVFTVIAFAMSARWPRTTAGWLHALFSGLLLHVIYLGGIWWAINQGVPSSISGVLAAVQPLLTALIAYWAVKERLAGAQKLGLVLGFVGLIIAIGPNLIGLDSETVGSSLFPLAVNIISMVSVTLGTIYQKKYLQEGDLIPIAGIQFLGASIFLLPFALLLEPMQVNWNIHTVLAMAWSVFGLSLGAITLLLFLIRKGQVSRAASLIYLIPAVVGFEAWVLFGEEISLPFIIGTVIVVIGVWLVNRKTTEMVKENLPTQGVGRP